MNKNIEILISSIEKKIFSSESKRWGIRNKFTGEIVELSGFVLGLWEDMKLSFLKNANGKSEEMILDFSNQKFKKKWEVFEIV